MQQRLKLLDNLADMILSLSGNPVLRVAIDGVDGAGKTTFADELAKTLKMRGKTVIRASVDGFHNPKSIRYQRGRACPDGFFLDSYNYPGLKQALLDPLSPGGSLSYCTAIFDHLSDSPVSMQPEPVQGGAILLFDGIFLHRSELRDYFDFSIFLDVEFNISAPRGAQRGPGFGSPDPESPENRRYVEGQRRYLKECSPQQRATVVIDNNNLLAPYIVKETALTQFQD